MNSRIHKSQIAMSLYGFAAWSWSHSLEMSFRDEDSFRHTLGGYASLSNGHFRSFCSVVISCKKDHRALLSAIDSNGGKPLLRLFRRSADRTRMPGSFRSSSMASSFRSEP